jgi:hypothetical protein
LYFTWIIYLATYFSGSFKSDKDNGVPERDGSPISENRRSPIGKKIILRRHLSGTVESFFKHADS